VNGAVTLLTAWVAMAAMMAAMWQWQRRTKNAGIVDVAWSYGTGACAAFFAFMMEGHPTRRWLVAGMALFWGVRLGTHLALRMARDEHEDTRYRALRDKWGEASDRNLLIFFQIQAAWCVMFALPMLAAASNLQPFPRWTDALGVLVWCLSITGEAVADRQLARFRADPANRGQVCRVGLWRCTRHPNYFAEWLQWWAWLLLAWGGERWWLAAAGVAVMYLFLNFVTGIPPTEKRLLASRGDAYRRYQQTTSAFFPWFPRVS
jgi:steroid 5-alpha reductase family enzyme